MFEVDYAQLIGQLNVADSLQKFSLRKLQNESNSDLRKQF